MITHKRQFQNAPEKRVLPEGVTRTKSGLLIPESLSAKAKEIEESARLDEPENSQTRIPETVETVQELAAGPAEQEGEPAGDLYDDLPDLEEPEQEPEQESEQEPVQEPTQDSTQDSTQEPAEQERVTVEADLPSEEPELIVINRDNNRESIFTAKATTAQSSKNIFADIVVDESDNETAASNDCFIKQSESQDSNRFLIEEVSSSSTSNVTPSETLEPSRAKKNPFLITEVCSNDISDMFRKQVRSWGNPIYHILLHILM